MRVFLAVGISLLTAACATEPATQAVSGSATTAGEDTHIEKQLCRYEKRTGTNFPKKMCKLPEVWAAIDKKQAGDAYDYTRQVFENGAVTNAKNNGQCPTCNSPNLGVGAPPFGP